MANPTTYFGWVMPNSADLVTDLPADFNVFGQGVDTSLQYLLGGTTGQVLSKTSGTNMAFTWINNDQGDITGVTAGNGISGGGTSGTVSVAIDTAITVDKTTAQTLTNKTLTSPALTTPTISTATTNGDILYGTGSGALQRLGIGTTGQVLNVASGVPSWATPASGGGMTLLSTTTLSGASTTISSISQDYVNLFLIVNGVNFNGTATMRIEPNATIDNADWAGIKYIASTITTTGSNATDINLSDGENVATSSTANDWAVLISGYTGTTYRKLFQWTGNFVVDSPTAQGRVFGFGNSLTNDAITSLKFKNNGGSFNAGTVKIYGVK